MAEAKDEPVKVELERLDGRTWGEYKRDIRALSSNALKKSEGRSLGERERELKSLGSYLQAAAHREMHAAMKDGKVVGFIVLKRESEPHKHAVIEQIRIRRGDGGHRLLHGMLQDLAKTLHDRGYHRCSINVKQGDKTALGKFQHDSWFTKMYGINEIELGDEEEGPIEEVDVMDDEEEGAMKEAA